MSIPSKTKSGEELSPAELQVYQLVASALPNKEIAALLKVQEGTIKHHVGMILRKKGMTNRVQLALAFHGFIIPNSSLPSAPPCQEDAANET